MFASLYGKTIDMGGTILGFPECNAFELYPVDESTTDTPFAFLQSTEDASVGFLVADPFSFYSDYQVELSEQEKEFLDVVDPEHVIVLAITTIAEPFAKSTINLLAPLLINTNNLRGKQIVLPPDTPFSTKMGLPEALRTGAGEPSC